MLVSAHFSPNASVVPQNAPLSGFAVGDIGVVVSVCADFLTDDDIEQAIFTAKKNKADADDNPTNIRKTIVTAMPGNDGTIINVNPDGSLRAISFNLGTSDTTKLAAPYFYDIRLFVRRAGTLYDRVVQRGIIVAGLAIGAWGLLQGPGDIALRQGAPTLVVIGTQNIPLDGDVTAQAPTLRLRGGQTAKGEAVVVAFAPTLHAAGSQKEHGRATVVAVAKLSATGGMSVEVSGGAIAQLAPRLAAGGRVQVEGSAALVASAPALAGTGGASYIADSAAVRAVAAIVSAGTLAYFSLADGLGVTQHAPTLAATGTLEFPAGNGTLSMVASIAGSSSAHFHGTSHVYQVAQLASTGRQIEHGSATVKAVTAIASAGGTGAPLLTEDLDWLTTEDGNYLDAEGVG